MTPVLHATFNELPIDRSDIPQEMLDLDSRERTNLFPWRGQFSPCLVELLLSTYSRNDGTVFDPFAGVGTTLFEAARKNLASFGTEINPAAIAMAETVNFIPLSRADRSMHLQVAESTLQRHVGHALPLFNDGSHDSRGIADLVHNAPSAFERSLITNALIRATKSTNEITASALYQAFEQHAEIVLGLPFSSRECKVIEADARMTGLKNESVDLVITSPPYINVFNYHQNNRMAMELLGRDVLRVAKSEFGSNRKHRGNRFLTVIQYCLDLRETFVELKRVLRSSGRIIFIVGRESNVRGVAFQNGSLVASLANMCGFRLVLRQERKFKNMFGEMIFEDILHFLPATTPSGKGSACELGIKALQESLKTKREPSVKADIEDAICSANAVNPSPLFKTQMSGLDVVAACNLV
jgi:hypothetical protein